jgi:hypothetical protein
MYNHLFMKDTEVSDNKQQRLKEESLQCGFFAAGVCYNYSDLFCITIPGKESCDHEKL